MGECPEVLLKISRKCIILRTSTWSKLIQVLGFSLFWLAWNVLRASVDLFIWHVMKHFLTWLLISWTFWSVTLEEVFSSMHRFFSILWFALIACHNKLTIYVIWHLMSIPMCLGYTGKWTASWCFWIYSR